MRVRPSSCFVLGLWVGGCTAFAPRSDYADYRRVRLADTGYERLVEARRYLDAHPQGWWAARLRRWRTESEPVMYERARASRETLRLYLRAYPNGVHADAARARLRALSTLAEHRQRHRRVEQRAQRATRRRLEERRREWASRAVRYWLRTFLELEGGGGRLPDVARRNPAFDRAFGRNPRPRCSRTECVKGYRLDYTVAAPGGSPVARSFVLWIRLHVHGGRLRRADIVLPDRGFSRWLELHSGKRIRGTAVTARERAITWTLEQMVSWVHEAAPGAKRTNVSIARIAPPASPIPFAEGRRRSGDTGATQREPDEPKGTDARAAATPAQVEGLVGFRLESAVVGVFAAPGSSSGSGYDGVFVEWPAADASQGDGRSDTQGEGS